MPDTDIPALLVSPGGMNAGEVTDNTALVAYEPSLGSERTRPVTKGNLLSDVPRVGASTNFGALTATSLSATTASLSSLTLGATLISGVLRSDQDITIANINAGATEDQALTITGAAVGDVVIANVGSWLPVGLTYQARVTALNTVTFRFTNNTASMISGATYAFDIVVLSVS